MAGSQKRGRIKISPGVYIEANNNENDDDASQQRKEGNELTEPIGNKRCATARLTNEAIWSREISSWTRVTLRVLYPQ